MAVLVATDFFTVEVLTLRGLITYYVLFFIHLESRRICLAGVTRHPDQDWMEQMARNVTMEDSGFLINRRSYGQNARPGRSPEPEIIALRMLMKNQARKVFCQGSSRHP
jgi:hypothetical protein